MGLTIPKPNDPNFKPKWIHELEDSKKISKDLIVLRGYVGPANDEKGFRIYFDPGMHRYVEFPDEALSLMDVTVVPAAGLQYVWLHWTDGLLNSHHVGDVIALRGYVGIGVLTARNPPAAGGPATPAEGTPNSGADAPTPATSLPTPPATPLPAPSAGANGAFRLYLDIDMTHYIEIPIENFRYGVKLKTIQSPLELCVIWIDADADVIERRTEVNRSYKAGLLEGVVVQDYLGGAVGIDLHLTDPQHTVFDSWSLQPGCPPSSGCPSGPNCGATPPSGLPTCT